MKVEGVTKSMVTNSDGEYLQEMTNRKRVPGRHGHHALHYRVKSKPLEDRELFIEGSPFANRYGQNVWSSGNVKLACTSTMRRLVQKLNISATPDTVTAWNEGDIELHRVDLAVNFRLESSHQVDEALTQLKRQLIEKSCQCTAYARYVAMRPRGGKHYSVAIYDKENQMSLKSSGNHAEALFQQLFKECEGILRFEVRLLRPELRKLKLTQARDWEPGTAREVFRKYFTRLPLGDVTFGPLSAADFEGIDERMRPVLALHKLNADWRQVYSERTRTRHKAYFKERGITLDCPSAPSPALSLATVLSGPNAIAKTPPWLIDAGMAPRLKRRKNLSTRGSELPTLVG
ncbi:phage/plasmid replication domain-containing protein [Paraburkholderia xenovorans]|uniref:phage/plasmid replication domain-containing protein n=1 Tax=Paraburkholderia xenovorans TaxID=36873 RepID=UPI0015C5478B|nr:phage/plasmid replication protein [Paraburkholderia xenovorans]